MGSFRSNWIDEESCVVVHIAIVLNIRIVAFFFRVRIVGIIAFAAFSLETTCDRGTSAHASHRRSRQRSGSELHISALLMFPNESGNVTTTDGHQVRVVECPSHTSNVSTVTSVPFKFSAFTLNHSKHSLDATPLTSGMRKIL